MNKEEFRHFIATHEEWVLGVIALLLVGLVVATFSWGITLVAEEVGEALTPFPGAGGEVKFNIEEAKALNLRVLQ